MAVYARVDNNAVVEQRDIDLQSVPDHKRALWVPIVGTPPQIDARWQTITGPTYQVETDQVVAVWTVTDSDLATIKEDLKKKVDEHAEALRLAVITPGAGQAQEYIAVKDEALAVLALADPSQATAEQYPMLAAGGGPLLAAAQTVKASADAWKVIGANIRQARLAGKAAITAAEDAQAAIAAFDAIVWP